MQAQWRSLVRDVAALICMWQEQRRQNRSVPPTDRHYVQKVPSTQTAMEDSDYIPLNNKSMQIVDDLEKAWGFDAATYAQVWKFWIHLKPVHGRHSTWIEHWIDYFIVNSLVPICNNWESQKPVRRQCWRVMAARTAPRKLLEMSGSALFHTEEQVQIWIHPGWPETSTTGWAFPLWEPGKVEIALSTLIGYDIRGDTTFGLSWGELREFLPESWCGVPLASLRPSAGSLGRIIGKQSPPIARLTLERLEQDESEDKVVDPFEAGFEEIMSTPANFFTNQQVRN